MLGVDGLSVHSQGVELDVIHEVVTCEVVVGQELAVVDQHLVARQHVGEPQKVGVALAVAEEHVAHGLLGVELPAGGGAGEDAHATPQRVPTFDALELGDQGDVVVAVGVGRHDRHPDPHVLELGLEESRVLEHVLRRQQPAHRGPRVDHIGGHQLGVVMTHVAGL